MPLARLCAKIRFPRFAFLYVSSPSPPSPPFLLLPLALIDVMRMRADENWRKDGAVAILELGVILLALLLNPSHRRREIEKALTMEQSGENTARSSFADDEEREEDFETAGEEEEGESGRNIGGEERRRDLERGVRGRVEIEDEMPLLK